MLPRLSLLSLAVLLATCSCSSSHFVRRLGTKLSLLSKSSKVAVASVLSCLALVGPLSSTPAVADPPKQQQVYFGAGCFWHVQHEMVETERKVLGRKDTEITVSLCPLSSAQLSLSFMFSRVWLPMRVEKRGRSPSGCATTTCRESPTTAP